MSVFSLSLVNKNILHVLQSKYCFIYTTGSRSHCGLNNESTIRNNCFYRSHQIFCHLIYVARKKKKEAMPHTIIRLSDCVVKTAFYSARHINCALKWSIRIFKTEELNKLPAFSVKMPQSLRL